MQGKKRVYRNRYIWVHPSNGRTSSTSEPGYIRYDSVLEYKVHCELKKLKVSFQHHKSLVLIPGIQGIFNSYSWECDFFLNPYNMPLEVKGKWILQKERASEKKLFEMQWALILSRYPKAKIVSDASFQIGQFEVYKYKEIESWAQWYSR